MGAYAVEEGATVNVGAVIGSIDAGTGASSPAAAPVAAAAAVAPVVATTPAPAPAAEAESSDLPLSPAVRRLVLELGIDPSKIKGTGKDGRLTKEDVVAAAKGASAASADAPVAATPTTQATGARQEERVKMTRLRQTIAKRLKSAQDTAALLTTFNDVDMSAVIEARATYKDLFEKKHGVRLGFMGFFTKAVALAARDVPAVNAKIEGDEIVYHNYLDVSVAVSAPNGLVVPVVRNADAMSFAQIEKAIGDFGAKAKAGTLTMDDMSGGTFTISNGGVFGSLMSTPIINPPQSAVLGLHRIEDRAVVRDGQVVVRPMMYLALSYDHRLIDGREAVTFLKIVKEAIEDPTRLLIDL
jgi:2-oxoglutarate dehydrogenase E2 component (dihydrolipoamide succinyltransferase)